MKRHESAGKAAIGIGAVGLIILSVGYATQPDGSLKEITSVRSSDSRRTGA